MATTSREADGPSTTDASLLRTERVEACPLCGSTAATTWRTGRDWQQPTAADRFEYRRCAQCGLYYLAVRPLESELGKVYFAGYGPYQAEPQGAQEPPLASFTARAAALPLHAAGAAIGLLGRRRLARHLDRIYTPETPGERLLDYGCGAPTFLDRARDLGFTTVGADFTEDVLQAVRAHGHRAVLVGKELEREIPDRSVGCARMNYVIEHLYHPREVLSSIRRKLRPGGRIHLSTPNPASIGSRLFGRRWHALDSPRHVILYRPRVLCALVEELGFRDISIAHEVGSKDLARSWGIVLYDRGRITHERIAPMAADRTRFGLFLPVAGLGAVLGAADRYHVFAAA
jgi:SAM-dependent methyltransferase